MAVEERVPVLQLAVVLAGPQLYPLEYMGPVVGPLVAYVRFVVPDTAYTACPPSPVGNLLAVDQELQPSNHKL